LLGIFLLDRTRTWGMVRGTPPYVAGGYRPLAVLGVETPGRSVATFASCPRYQKILSFAGNFLFVLLFLCMENLDIQTELSKIEARNKRVELDKAWETSFTRKLLIAVFTYIVIVSFFLVADLGKPFVNPIVPTLGYLLSTLSLSYFKAWWMKSQK